MTCEAIIGGYNFTFSYCDAGNDPPVYLYEEGEPEPTKVCESFTQWLHLVLDDDLGTVQRLRESKFDIMDYWPKGTPPI
jgi:hypothetical protein